MANEQGVFDEFRPPHGKHDQRGDDFQIIYMNGLLGLLFSFGVLFTSLKTITARSWLYGTGILNCLALEEILFSHM